MECLGWIPGYIDGGLGFVHTISNNFEALTERARDAVKQGYKDKLGLFMITQNPEDIDSDNLKQTNTNIAPGLHEEVITKIPSHFLRLPNKTSKNTIKANPSL